MCVITMTYEVMSYEGMTYLLALHKNYAFGTYV